MDPICPLLSLGGDPRVVSATPDDAHRCLADGTPAPIEREYQVRFCLTARHETCERYLAHLADVGPVGPTWRPAAPDSAYGSTRLVMESAPRSVIRRRPRRFGMAALFVIGLVLVGVLVAWIGLGSILAPPAGSPTPSATASATPEESASPSPSPSPTPEPTPTPIPTPTPVPAPTPISYIVQSGDTLNEIASRFGTTAQAIADFNGINVADPIQVGQVLLIPVS
ncbi:MAG TPA: LysM domain-containing protein [Candidatus Limnocylindria bacterium]|nr:LysM domain-containing protein [Candidatus Limnocylindria bacterium]